MASLEQVLTTVKGLRLESSGALGQDGKPGAKPEPQFPNPLPGKRSAMTGAKLAGAYTSRVKVSKSKSTNGRCAAWNWELNKPSALCWQLPVSVDRRGVTGFVYNHLSFCGSITILKLTWLPLGNRCILSVCSMHEPDPRGDFVYMCIQFSYEKVNFCVCNHQSVIVNTRLKWKQSFSSKFLKQTSITQKAIVDRMMKFIKRTVVDCIVLFMPDCHR